jgi:hypothetical protein
MVKKVWERTVVGVNPIQRWNDRLHAMRKHPLGGWARHLSGVKKREASLINLIDALEALAEV